jgi:CBS domain-containing protein
MELTCSGPGGEPGAPAMDPGARALTTSEGPLGSQARPRRAITIVVMQPGDPARSSSAPAAPGDVVDFLRAHPPFDALEAADLERVATATEIEFFLAGSMIFSQSTQPLGHLRVVRTGPVEIVLAEQVLDPLGADELFGQASMLSGLPPGFAARAHEDTLCYRIPEGVARAVLARPESVGFLARSLLAMRLAPPALAATRGSPPDPANTPVAELIRDPPALCGPETTVREAAARMAAAGATSIVIERGDSLGVLTDRDLRSRVVASGLPYDAPVSSAMSAPAYTVEPDRLGGDVLLEMLDRGIRHFPVSGPHREVLGVVEATDLLAVEALSSFHLRRAIAAAERVGDLALAAQGLRPAVIALHEARMAASSIATIYSVLLDALTRRPIELSIARAGEPAGEFSWLPLGSQARREATPGSDADSAMVWFGEVPERPSGPIFTRWPPRSWQGSASAGSAPTATA